LTFLPAFPPGRSRYRASDTWSKKAVCRPTIQRPPVRRLWSPAQHRRLAPVISRPATLRCGWELLNCHIYKTKAVSFEFDEVNNPYFMVKHYPEIGKSLARRTRNDDSLSPAEEAQELD
jgi:hypothetical protein